MCVDVIRITGVGVPWGGGGEGGGGAWGGGGVHLGWPPGAPPKTDPFPGVCSLRRT